MLDGRWYNASSHYIRGNLTFEAPFILLYPVTRLLSFVQKERIYAGVLFMPHLNPYLEFGYGFATHLFDVGVFIGNEKVNLPPWDVNLPSNYSTNKIVALY